MIKSEFIKCVGKRKIVLDSVLYEFVLIGIGKKRDRRKLYLVFVKIVMVF